MNLIPFPATIEWADTKNISKGVPSQTFKQYLYQFTTNIPWAPVDQSGAGLPAFTTISVGAILFPNSVYISGRFTFPVTANGAACLIGGLPLPSVNQNYGSALGQAFCATPAKASFISIVKGTSTFVFADAATGVAYNNVQLSNGLCSFSCMYPLT